VNDESNGSWVITKQGVMGVAKSQICTKKSAHDRRSTSDPDVLEKVNGVGPGLMIQLEGEL